MPSGAPSTEAQRPLAGVGPVVCVSHGFQTNYERGFCNGLAANGVDVTLVSSDRTDAAGMLPGVRLCNLRGSQEEQRPRWAKALNMLRYHALLLAYSVWRWRSTVHVIGLIDPPTLYGVVHGLWFRLFNRRYVLTVHNLLPHGRDTPALRRWHRWAYRLPQHMVVHTERMRERLVQEFGVPPQRVVVMEHGIEPPSAAEAAAAQAGEHRPREPGQPFRLLVFGKVAPYKGIEVLLQALAHWAADQPFELLVAGPASSGTHERSLAELFNQHPHRAWLQRRNAFVPEAEMVQLFQQADAVVLPYLHIDQSGVLFQALRHGTPIVATRVGEFAQYVTPEVGELALPEDPAGLSTALRRLQGRLPSLSRRAIRATAKAYEWPTVVVALTVALGGR